MTPGNCWAFAGDRGQVTIRLAQKVYLSNITLQHIPKTISLSGSLDTAPKDFVIYVSTRLQGGWDEGTTSEGASPNLESTHTYSWGACGLGV